MPTLDWIGKEVVVKHHKDVPYRLLEPDAALFCSDDTSGNLIVQGDNLHALKALLPRHAGKVKCIYIDPPYSTGNEGWIFNDNVSSPEMHRRFRQCRGICLRGLARYPGAEGENRILGTQSGAQTGMLVLPAKGRRSFLPGFYLQVARWRDSGC